MGFPSPAEDFVQTRIYPPDKLIVHPAATFFMRVETKAMLRSLIGEGDTVVIDRAIRPAPGDIVIAIHEGEFMARRLVKREGRHLLIADDTRIRPLTLDGSDCIIWGTITYSIRRHKE